MIRDPNIFLQRAKYFSSMANNNGVDGVDQIDWDLGPDQLLSYVDCPLFQYNNLPTAFYPETYLSANPETYLPANPETYLSANPEIYPPANPETYLPANPETYLPANPEIPVTQYVPIIDQVEIVDNIDIKPSCRRFYDPVTKHYYNVDRIFSPNANGIVQAAKPDPDIWYPENKLNFKHIQDPVSGKYYRINKIYDSDGNISFGCKPQNESLVKNPGTNYYRPIKK